jgi:hypothetical protein
MLAYDLWKKGFDTWESATAKLVEEWVKSPFLLEPSGRLLDSTMKAKVASEQALANFWAFMGLPTKRDQERTLHTLNQIQSRLLDLEEKVTDIGGASETRPSRHH